MSGLCFRAPAFRRAPDSWIKSLPASVCEGGWDAVASAEVHRQVCGSCQGRMTHPHECAGWWVHFAATVRRDTRLALDLWAKKNAASVPTFNAGDVVIYDRCEENDSIFGHVAYGPAGWSLYNTIACDEGCSLTVVCVPETDHGVCLLKRVALLEFLFRRHPLARVRLSCEHTNCMVEAHNIGGVTDSFNAFYHIVFAPNVYADLSTFALWGGVANTGVVRMPAVQSFIYTGFASPGFVWENTSSLLGTQPDMAAGGRVDAAKLRTWLLEH